MMKLGITKAFLQFRKYKKKKGRERKFDSYITEELNEWDVIDRSISDERLRIIELGETHFTGKTPRGYLIDKYPQNVKLWIGDGESECIASITFHFGCFETLIRLPYIRTDTGVYEFPVNVRTTIRTLLRKTRGILTKENAPT